MLAYSVRRLLLIIPTLLIVSLITFITIRIIPGSVVDAMITEMGGTITQESDAALREMIEHRLGLDVPLHVQYGRWLKGIVLHGNLGESMWTQTSVTSEIAAKLPVTIELGLIALVVALLVSLPIGVYSAIRQDSVGDYIGRSFAIACIAIPPFWLGVMVVMYGAIWMNWSPPIFFTPFFEDPSENLAQIFIPGIILGMTLMGVNMRMIRAMMLEVLREDYIRTAWSKGLKERVVIIRHALKNAIFPVITLIGLQLPVLVSGAVILEQIFLLPGTGRYFLLAALKRDYTAITGIVMVLAVFIVFVNLAIDLLYGYLDPRVKYR